MPLRLRSDWILVELEPEKRVTSSGIIVPGTSENPVRIGLIKQAGPGRQYPDCYRPTQVAPGERVVFFIGSTDTQSGKQLVGHLDPNHRLIRENDILCVVEGAVEASL